MSKQLPNPAPDAEIIVRQRLYVEVGEGKLYPVPELLVLGNAAGFRWLSEYFGLRAHEPIGTNCIAQGDPDDHDHLSWDAPAVNSRLSDELEVRVGLLTAENREQVMAKYALERSAPQRGSLIKRYKEVIRWARWALRRSPKLSGYLGYMQYTMRGSSDSDETAGPAS